MFKNLKKKLEQGVNQSPLRGALASASKFLDDKPPDGDPLAESTPKKTGNQAAGDAGNQSLESNASNYATANQSINDSMPTENQSVGGGATAEVVVGQLVDIPLQDTSSESSSTPIPGDVTPLASRSRTSSISSVTSDSSFFTNVSYVQPHYSLPSDMESEVDESGTDLHTVSKEDLYQYIQKYQRRATRYKSKFMEVVAVYKDMMQERDKFKNTLTQSQDRAFRRISELKEQIHLDQKAKLDVEENYSLVIEEKGEFIKVLQTQVRLLKEGKEIPPELEEKILAGKVKTLEENTKSDEMSTQISSLKDKVKHQEGLLQRCKEIIRTNKEKQVLLAEENDGLQKQYEDVQKDLARLKGASSPDTVSKLTKQIQQARGVIEQLETDRQLAIAEVKQQVHGEMERRDVELSEARRIALTATEENSRLTNRLDKLEKTGGEQLEKSREIIRQLKEDKQRAFMEMETRLKEAEDDMENEKSSLVQELSRGKSAAITLLQEQTEKQLQDQVDAAVMARDDLWQTKMSDQEMAHQEIIANKEKELQKKATRLQDETQTLIAEKEHALHAILQESKGALKERERDMQLAMEERDLVKMATLSQQDALQDQLQAQIHALQKEKLELETLVQQMQEENENMKNEYARQLKEGVDLSEKQMAQLRIEHERYVAELLTEHEKSIQQKTDNLIDKHAQHVAELIRKHEDSLQSSHAEVEKYYISEMKKLKSNMERLLHEKNQQTETLNLTIQHLRTDLATNQQEFEQRSIEFKVKMEENNESYKKQMTECDNLQKELNNVREEYEMSKSQMEEELSLLRQNVQTISDSLSCAQTENTDLKDQVNRRSESSALVKTENSEVKAKLDRLSEIKSAVETENSELKCQLDRLNKEVDEKYQSADSKVKELLGQVTEFEAKQMDLCQEKQKLLDANNECVKQIKTMDKTISEKDTQIDELKTNISEVTGELDRINSEKQESVIEKENVIKLNSANEDRLRVIETEKEMLLERVTTLETETQNSSSVADELNMSLSVKEAGFLEEKRSLTDQINNLKKELDMNREELQKKIVVLSEREEEVRTLNITCDELQLKTSSLENQLVLLQNNMEQTEGDLKQSKEKFNQLRTEAKNRIKELKDKHIDESAEQEQTWSNKVQGLEEQIKDEVENKKSLEENFKTQFQEKQTKFKDSCNKIKESFQAKLKKKDEEFESKLADLVRQKDINAGDVTRNLENVYAQQATEMRERHADDIKSLTNKLEEQLEKQKETYETDISKLGNQCDILRNELEKNRAEFESERARLLEKQEHNENELRKSFEETINSLQVQLSEIHSKHEESNSVCSKLTLDNENIHKQHNLTVADHLTTIAEHENRSEQVNRKMLNLSEQHAVDIQEKELMIANITARISDLENTNTSMEEMLKAMNTQCQEKDDKIVSLLEENKNIQELKKECQTNIISLENSVKELQGVCSDQTTEIQTIHDEASMNIKNVREEYENKLVDMSSSDEELQSHLKVLNDKLSDTEKKLHDCMHEYEAQIVEYKNKLDRQGRSQSEEKEVLASQLFEMTTQSHKRTEELQTALDTSITEIDGHRLAHVSEIKELESRIATLEFSLSEKSGQLSEMEGIIQERETHMAELEIELKESQEEKSRANNNVIELETSVKQLQEVHESQMSTFENNWQSKANEMKQKFLKKLKEVQSHGEEKVNVFKETLRQERAGSEERVSALQGNLKDEFTKAEEMSSELAHANTKLLQLDQSKETINELDSRIKSLEELVNEKDELVNEYVVKCKEIEETLCATKKDLSEKCELINELQAHMHSDVSEHETRIKRLDMELQLEKESLSKSESANQLEKEGLYKDIQKLQQELTENKSELTNLTDSLSACNSISEEQILKSKCVENELTQKVESYNKECTEKVKLIKSLEEQLENANVIYQDSVCSIQKYRDEIVELTTEKESLKSAIETLETKTCALSNELETSVSELTGSSSAISDLQSSSIKHEQEKSELQQKCKDLEDKISHISTDLLKAKDANLALETSKNVMIKEIHETHEKDKEDIKSKFESESANKVAEFKKKAELYISQIKKQVQGEKETSDSESKTTISDLQNKITSLEQKLDQLKTEKDNINTQFEKEKLEIEQRFRDQIDSKEKLEQAHLQKAESSTSFIEQLKLSLGKEKAEKENLNDTIQKLSQEKREMETKTSDLEKKYKTDINNLESEFQDMKIAKDEEIETLEVKVKAECDKMSKHYESLLQAKDNDHMSKIKELLKEFNQKFSAKENEYESSFTEMLEKSGREESASQREMQQLLTEARGEIQERDDRLDEVRMEYETKLKDQTAALQAQAEDHQRQVVDLTQRHEIAVIELQEAQSRSSQHNDTMHREEVTALANEWKVERQSVAPLSSAAPPHTEAQELLRYNQQSMDAVQSGCGAGDLGHQVLVLTEEIGNLKEKHRLELAEVRGQTEAQKSFLPQPLIATPDGATNNPGHLDNQYLEVQAVSMQARVAQLEGQLAQSRLQGKELVHSPHSNSYGSYGSPSSPGFYTDGTPSGPLLTEPTQLEYLRNILYMYMMGKQKKTLCRVIGTVVHFSEDQMKQLLAKEDSAVNWLT